MYRGNHASNYMGVRMLVNKERNLVAWPSRGFMTALFLGIGLVIGSVSVSSKAIAQSADSNVMKMGENVGLVGYDPVSYFPDGGSKPAKGFVLRSHDHKGVTYRFASDVNLAKFKATPEKYLPQFGGWCAWALAKLDKKVDIDPESYLVTDGKLYVFYNHKELDTRADWIKNAEDFLPKAKANWSKVVKK